MKGFFLSASSCETSRVQSASGLPVKSSLSTYFDEFCDITAGKGS